MINWRNKPFERKENFYLQLIWKYVGRLISGLPDQVNRDLHRRDRSPVLQPVQGIPVLRPAHSRTIIGGNSIAMVRDRPLQDVDNTRSVLVVMQRTKNAAGFDGHHAHAILPACHALDLGSQLKRCKQYDCHTFRFRCQ